MKRAIIYLLIRFHSWSLYLYPAAFRVEFGEEMGEVFAAAVDEAGQKGAPAVTSVCVKEMVTFPGSLLSAYAKGWQTLQPEPVLAPGFGWVFGWALLTTASVPVAWFLSAQLGAALILPLNLVFRQAFEPPALIGINTVRPLGFLLTLSLTIATVQWLLLRRHLPHAGCWIPVTILGWLAAGIMITTLGNMFLGPGTLPALFTRVYEQVVTEIRLVESIDAVLGPALSLTWLIQAIMSNYLAALSLILFTLTGATVGLSQWLFLRRVMPRAGWWLLISLSAITPFLVAGRSFGSLLEMAIFLLFPGIVSGMGLWLLLHQGPQSAMGAIQSPRRPVRRPFSRRLLWAGLAFLLLIPLFAIAPLAYTKSQLELAKREGIYTTVEEAAIDRLGQGWGGAEVVRLEGLYVVPNWSDGRLPHVRFGGARVWLDRVPDGYFKDNYAGGSYYIQVEEGWVHVSEGSFPVFIGRMMEIYGLEGVGRNGSSS